MIAWPLLFVVLGILFIAFAGLGSLFRARVRGYEGDTDGPLYTSRDASLGTGTPAPGT